MAGAPYSHSMKNQDTPDTAAALESDAVSIHELARDYVLLDDQIKDARELIKALEEKKRAVGDRLFDGMLTEGAPSIEVESRGGKAKVYPTSQIWARGKPDVDKGQFYAALRDADLGDLITASVHTGKLSAMVREIAEAGGVKDSGPTRIIEALPEVLRPVISVTTTPTLAIRRKK